jgi:hypothetical protein
MHKMQSRLLSLLQQPGGLHSSDVAVVNASRVGHEWLSLVRRAMAHIPTPQNNRWATSSVRPMHAAAKRSAHGMAAAKSALRCSTCKPQHHTDFFPPQRWHAMCHVHEASSQVPRPTAPNQFTGCQCTGCQCTGRVTVAHVAHVAHSMWLWRRWHASVTKQCSTTHDLRTLHLRHGHVSCANRGNVYECACGRDPVDDL